MVLISDKLRHELNEGHRIEETIWTILALENVRQFIEVYSVGLEGLKDWL